jgi:hypothetical protein
MTHHAIGYAILAFGAFLGIIAVAVFVWEQVDKARDRQARVDWDKTLVDLRPLRDTPWNGMSWTPPEPGWEFERYAELASYVQQQDWPAEGEATRHFFGTDLVAYDPEADAAEFMRKQKADTDSFIAQRITAELECVPA